jgi:hypothetical protein
LVGGAVGAAVAKFVVVAPEPIGAMLVAPPTSVAVAATVKVAAVANSSESSVSESY